MLHSEERDVCGDPLVVHSLEEDVWEDSLVLHSLEGDVWGDPLVLHSQEWVSGLLTTLDFPFRTVIDLSAA